MPKIRVTLGLSFLTDPRRPLFCRSIPQIRDLVPSLARAYFGGRLPVSISFVQAAILVSLGLQMGDVSAVETALNLPSNQVLALFNKLVRKLHGVVRGAAERRVSADLPHRVQVEMAPHEARHPLAAPATLPVRTLHSRWTTRSLTALPFPHFPLRSWIWTMTSARAPRA